MIDHHLQHIDDFAARKEFLRFGQRHENDGLVVFRHSQFEHRADHVRLGARTDSERRRCPARRNESDVIAQAKPECVREPDTDRNALLLVESFERPVTHVTSDQRQGFEPALGHAAHQRTEPLQWRRRQHLRLDQRHHVAHAGHLGDLGCNIVVVGEIVAGFGHDHMAIEAQNLREQILPEPVHHRHDDNERCHPQHDAQERKSGNDRDKSFLPPRAKVAPRNHPFERRKGRCRSGSLEGRGARGYSAR